MITFIGNVSKQEVVGEVVNITVTRPDGQTSQVQGATDANGNYSATYDDIPAIGYSAVASIDEDNLYLGATSPTLNFDIPKGARVLTLNIATPLSRTLSLKKK